MSLAIALSTKLLQRCLSLVLLVLLFGLAPVLNVVSPSSAQALPLIQSEAKPADRETVEAIKRIQTKAEDVGEARRDIGETGLKNIRKLGENIPETVDLNARNTAQKQERGAKNLKDLRDRA